MRPSLYSGLHRAKDDVLHTTIAWEIIRFTALTYFRVFHFVRIRGVENIPQHGGMIFAPNHVSYYDPPLIGAGIPFKVRFMAWDRLFQIPLFGRAIRAVGAFPVKLQSADKRAIEQTLRILRNGESVVIFPEGERTKGGELQEFEQGVARMALQTGAWIVPVTITGMDRAWPRTKLFPRLFTPITVKYHPPIAHQRAENRDELKSGIQRLNAQMRAPIARRLEADNRRRMCRSKSLTVA